MQLAKDASRLTLCGSLSRYPVSIGAAMHLAGYRELGLPFTYVPFEVSDLEGAIRGMRALKIRGLGVSMPFKEAVIPLLDELSAEAARIGAVNTVVYDEGRLWGHNTDSVGAVRALEEVTSLDGSRVLLLGAGGAAKAIAFGLASRGANVCIANRDEEKARSLATRVGATAAPWSERTNAAAYDVVVQATSVGMKTDDSRPIERVLEDEHIRGGQVVMDVVYKPIHTELVQSATRRGARVIHGGRMLLHQAARQFELYTELQAPLEAMDRALRERIG